MNLDEFWDSHPYVHFHLEELPFDQTMLIARVIWGDTGFGMLKDGVDDTDTWIHEFTEISIAYTFEQIGEKVLVDSISQIIGHADGLEFDWRGEKIFGTITHILTSLAVGSYIPIKGGFMPLTPDECWEVFNERPI